jgi:hypothetical protein
MIRIAGTAEVAIILGRTTCRSGVATPALSLGDGGGESIAGCGTLVDACLRCVVVGDVVEGRHLSVWCGILVTADVAVHSSSIGETRANLRRDAAAYKAKHDCSLFIVRVDSPSG